MELPEAALYEAELRYMPYRDSLSRVLSLVVRDAPRSSRVLDLMCGTGFLLGKIAEQARDLVLVGVDIDPRYITHGKKAYPGIGFECGNVLDWQSESLYDLILCTGALHHVEYELQGKALANTVTLLKPGGTVIISDCYIDDYDNEVDRQIAAAKLGYEYLIATIANGAPPNVVEETVKILRNDVMREEFKTSLAKRLALLGSFFTKVETLKSWPDYESEFGDYIHICGI